MTPDPSLPTDSRRDFVKKSIAATIIVAQPTILAGLIRAEGGGGPTTTTMVTTAPANVLLSETKHFASQTVLSTQTYGSAPAALAAAQTAFEGMLSFFNAYNGTQQYGPKGTKEYSPQLYNGSTPVAVLSAFEVSPGNWKYEIIIPDGDYTVVYYVEPS